MTWRSLPLLRNTRRMCNCYDCLRSQGITAPGIRDCLGFYRDEKDGRFTAIVTEYVTDKEGITKPKTTQRRTYIGT